MADAAHELRGPLTAISLGLEALERHPAARRRAEALAIELCRMDVAADDVSAAARGRRAAARISQVPLRQLVERSGEAWLSAAVRRGGRVVFDWQAGRAEVRADPRRLAQAFGNLLANAVEHGGGQVVVRGRPANGVVRVEVEDGGTQTPTHTGVGRGRGLRIAGRALEEVDGRIVSLDRPDGGRVAVAEIPIERKR